MKTHKFVYYFKIFLNEIMSCYPIRTICSEDFLTWKNRKLFKFFLYCFTKQLLHNLYFRNAESEFILSFLGKKSILVFPSYESANLTFSNVFFSSGIFCR